MADSLWASVLLSIVLLARGVAPDCGEALYWDMPVFQKMSLFFEYFENAMINEPWLNITFRGGIACIFKVASYSDKCFTFGDPFAVARFVCTVSERLNDNVDAAVRVGR